MNRTTEVNPIKIVQYILLFLLMPLLLSYSQEKGRHTPFNLSLIYPISINRTPYDNVDINIGLIGSRFGNLTGFSFNSVYSILEKDLKGFQVNGLYAETRGNLLGLQLTGGVNVVKGNSIGAMIALIGNMSFGDFKGFQIAGLGNTNFENFSGLQISGALNVAGSNVNTLQLTGLGNIAAGNLKGAQVSAFFNILGNQNRGLQISTLNLAREVRGLQLGVFNVARNNTGVQLGLFNFVMKKQRGTTLGLFYIYEKTRINLLASAGNFAYGSAGARFKTNNIYTMLSLGAPVVHSSTTKSIMAEFRAGYSFPTKHFNINGDAGYSHIVNELDQVEGKPSRNQFAFVFRTGLERKISKIIGLFINSGYILLADSYEDPKFNGKFLIEGGVVLF